MSAGIYAGSRKKPRKTRKKNPNKDRSREIKFTGGDKRIKESVTRTQSTQQVRKCLHYQNAPVKAVMKVGKDEVILGFLPSYSEEQLAERNAEYRANNPKQPTFYTKKGNRRDGKWIRKADMRKRTNGLRVIKS